MSTPYDLAAMTPHSKNRTRDVGRRSEVRHVEASECDGLPVGPHELTNTASGDTYCGWCGKTWAELDAEINHGLKSRERP